MNELQQLAAEPFGVRHVHVADGDERDVAEVRLPAAHDAAAEAFSAPGDRDIAVAA